jgi:hypothetical protein
MDSLADENFIDDCQAKKLGFMPSVQCNKEFVAFDGTRFLVTHAYDLLLIVTDNRGHTKNFEQRFYSCKNTGYSMVLGLLFLNAKGAGYYDWKYLKWTFAPSWDDIDIVDASEFNELISEPHMEAQAQILFVSRGDCDCLINHSRCRCGGSQWQATTP